MTKYQNFGDCSVHHGQVWIANDGDSDFAPPVVVINSGSDIGLADNQYMRLALLAGVITGMLRYPTSRGILLGLAMAGLFHLIV